MRALNPIVGSGLRFALLFLLLSAPWPGWKELSAAGLRSLTAFAFGGDAGAREILWEAHPHEAASSSDTRAVIVNRNLLNREGFGPVRNLELDLGSLELRSATLLVALILATPMAWRHRAKFCLFGLVLLQGILLAIVGFSVWVESAEVGLVEFSRAEKSAATGLEMGLIGQSTVAVPVLLWLCFVYRSAEARRIWSRPAAWGALPVQT